MTNQSNNNSSTNLIRRSSTLLSMTSSFFQRAPSLRDLQSSAHDIEFFASLETNTDLAFFRRSEVQIGDLLTNSGRFGSSPSQKQQPQQPYSRVCAIEGFSPDATTTTSSEEDDNNDERRRSFRRRRQDLLLTESSESDSSNKNKKYALKYVPTQDISDKRDLCKAVKELINDAKFLSRLQHHPNILQLHGLTMDAYGCCFLSADFSDFFLITNRVEETLAQRIHQWRCKSQDNEPDEDLIPMKSNYAFQIAKAIQHCHQHGILVRGLQPTRIAFSSSDDHVLQLTDFGLAREFPPCSPKTKDMDSDPQEQAYKMTLAGTRRYIDAQALSTGKYTWKSDVYSWSMVWYEMLTQHKPYAGLSAMDHQRFVCEQGERPDLSHLYLPDHVDEILMAAWDPCLKSRPSMKQVCDKMQSFLMDLDVDYYEQQEGDFLFDIQVVVQNNIGEKEDDLISDIQEDDFLLLDLDDGGWMEGNDTTGDASTASLSSSLERHHISEDGDDEEDNDDDRQLMTSWKSFESTRTKRTLSSMADEGKPLKIISEAA